MFLTNLLPFPECTVLLFLKLTKNLAWIWAENYRKWTVLSVGNDLFFKGLSPVNYWILISKDWWRSASTEGLRTLSNLQYSIKISREKSFQAKCKIQSNTFSSIFIILSFYKTGMLCGNYTFSDISTFFQSLDIFLHCEIFATFYSCL